MPRQSGARFTAIKSEGGLLPTQLLERVLSRDGRLEGLNEAAYHLVDGTRLHEAITASWARLERTWANFQPALAPIATTDPATTLTRERWLLPFFAELGYGRLPAVRPAEVEGRTYGVSHAWQGLPLHLVGWNVDLDTRTAGVAGAARVSPHGLVQELLNRSRDHLWGVVSNGRRLRLLRDNVSLTRQAYVEFDLQAIFGGEVYADFAVLWLLLHESRVEQERPADWLLERWAQEAQRQGVALQGRLRDQVQAAIEALGRGFLAHPTNGRLREALQSGRLDGLGYYRQLLRLIYRLLFLFVSEDREVLLDPTADKAARDRYIRFYSTARLRTVAGRLRGTTHYDLWRGLSLVMGKLGDDAGCAELGLPALGSLLWSLASTPDLNESDLLNRDFLAAVRALAWTEEVRLRRPVDYRNLGPEELGSVYEALLELHPEVNVEGGTFTLASASGHERKTTGSYYTPRPLIQCLLDSALDPVLDEAARARDPEAAILALKVCDPACGSGHFLIAAAHRIARRLATVRSRGDEPSPEAVRHALRDVIGRCLYGVDVNEMAVELCKVGLWMEALEPGRPLSFLDHRIVCGNSLLGTTPTLLAQGIPDDAFQAIEGDDKAVVTALRRRNRSERQGQMELPMVAEAGSPYEFLGSGFAALGAAAEDTIGALRDKERQFTGLLASEAYRRARLLADAWCAAFVWRKARGAPEPVTEDVLLRLHSDPKRVSESTHHEIQRLATQYRFLHWHLAFPDVFRLPKKGETPENEVAGWNGGFDVVLGNPPWEQTELEEREWFASRRPDISEASNAHTRKGLIQALRVQDPCLYAAWIDASRSANAERHLLRNSGRYPLCGQGRINTYAVFAETNRLIAAPTGCVGCIVPTGIATDDTTKEFFQGLVECRALVSLHSFFEIRAIFLDTDSRNPFCLLTLTGPQRPVVAGSDFVFSANTIEDLQDNWRHFTLTPEDISLLNPNTRTCPIFRSRHDAELTRSTYQRVPVLIRETPPEENVWGIRYSQGLFNMAADSALFGTREQLEPKGWSREGHSYRHGEGVCLPLYEAKMIHHFDHRFGDYADQREGSQTTALPDVPAERLVNPAYIVEPRYWVPAAEVSDRLVGKWDRGWLLAWRDICRATDERTVIASLIPRVGVGHTTPLMFPANANPLLVGCLLANLCAFVLDYSARQKVGGTHLTYGYLNQLPVLPPATYARPAHWALTGTLESWLLPRILELVYTAWDLTLFARDCGHDGPPFRWDEERRFHIRAEMDAAFFHLYGISRDEADYIMNTFPIVRRDDEKRYGEYRTKRIILEVYDALSESIASGSSYRTVLDPPPGDLRCCHPSRDSGAPTETSR